jgi:hypothetical protein
MNYLNNILSLYTLILSLLAMAIYLAICSLRDKEPNVQLAIVAVAVLVVSSIALSYYLSYKMDMKLHNAFNANKRIICTYKNHSNEGLIVKKDLGYELINGYFIKNDKAIDISQCDVLIKNLEKN